MRGLLLHLTSCVCPHTLAVHLWDAPHTLAPSPPTGTDSSSSSVFSHTTNSASSASTSTSSSSAPQNAVELLVLCARWGVELPQSWVTALLEVRVVWVCVGVCVCVCGCEGGCGCFWVIQFSVQAVVCTVGCGAPSVLGHSSARGACGVGMCGCGCEGGCGCLWVIQFSVQAVVCMVGCGAPSILGHSSARGACIVWVGVGVRVWVWVCGCGCGCLWVIHFIFKLLYARWGEKPPRSSVRALLEVCVCLCVFVCVCVCAFVCVYSCVVCVRILVHE